MGMKGFIDKVHTLKKYQEGEWFTASHCATWLHTDQTCTTEWLCAMYKEGLIQRRMKSGRYHYKKLERNWLTFNWRKRSNAQLGIKWEAYKG